MLVYNLDKKGKLHVQNDTVALDLDQESFLWGGRLLWYFVLCCVLRCCCFGI